MRIFRSHNRGNEMIVKTTYLIEKPHYPDEMRKKARALEDRLKAEGKNPKMTETVAMFVIDCKEELDLD